MDMAAVAAQLRVFAADRDWDQFHNPKNLAMALAGEAGELLEVFQWLTPDQAADLTPDQRTAAAEELADVLIYLIRLADKLGIDLDTAVSRKIEANGQRYPARQVRGVASKPDSSRTA
jgi:NTP pyrophosphatase (non-canonical NTP hydrolase)